MVADYRMPRCTDLDVGKIALGIFELKPRDCTEAVQLAGDMSPKGLCMVLHAMRRWYSYQSWNAAKKILAHREALRSVMDLEAPVGAFRGFKVDVESPIAQAKPGDVLSLEAWRNGGCTSWTLERKLADRFSGASKGKVGVVVRLASDEGVTAFLAPPSRTVKWFDELYAATMGTAFRFKEHEYAVRSPKFLAEVVRIKRR